MQPYHAYFTLARRHDDTRAVPATGEDNGAALAKAGELLLADYRSRNAVEAYYGPLVAQIFMLAADAYEKGAAVSIGHNRSDRYHARAKELRREAEALCVEADKEKERRDKAWAEREAARDAERNAAQ